jgi:hypothetical protein
LKSIMSTTHHRTASKLRTVGSSSRTEDPSDSDRDEDGEGGGGEGGAGGAGQEASEAATQKRLSAGYDAVLQAQERLDTRSSSFGEASETVLKAGYVFKRGMQWPRKWRRRWLLLAGHTLRYYVSSDLAEEKGRIRLLGRPPSVPTGGFGPAAGDWEIPGAPGEAVDDKDGIGKPYTLRCETEEEAAEWAEIVTRWSCTAAQRASLEFATELHASMCREAEGGQGGGGAGVGAGGNEAEGRGWPEGCLSELTPTMDSRGAVACAQSAGLHVPRLGGAIARRDARAPEVLGRIRLGEALVDPAFIPFPARGRLQVDPLLRPWFYQCVATKNVILHELQQWAVSLEVDGIGGIEGEHFAAAFSLATQVVFHRRPVATDDRIGYNTFGERLEADKQVYEPEDWASLADALDVLNQLVISKPSAARRAAFTPRFARRVVGLLASDDARERQALAPVVLSLYVEASTWRESEALQMSVDIDTSADVQLDSDVRAMVLRVMHERFVESVYESCRKEGVNELLNVLACILADIDR